MLFKFDDDKGPEGPPPVLEPSCASFLCCEGIIIAEPAPFVLGLEIEGPPLPAFDNDMLR